VTSPTERRIALPGLRLAAQQWGDPNSPALLAVHGWLDNAGSFAALAPRLAERWRVIALELPGHGHSDHLPPGQRYHFIDYVRTVLDTVTALGLSRIDLLGHSLGAGIASLVAAAAPPLVRQLWLIEGLGPLGDDGSDTLQRFQQALEPSVLRDKPLRSFSSIELAVAARTRASGLPMAQARPIVERGLLEGDGGWCWRSDPRLTRTSPLRLAETQVHALLRGIQAPTRLLLATPATIYLPGPQIEARAACVADIRIEYLAGGHHLHLALPDAVAAWINASAVNCDDCN
jgi:pimeloyl-ACP methyl ester carboxylesterase